MDLTCDLIFLLNIRDLLGILQEDNIIFNEALDIFQTYFITNFKLDRQLFRIFLQYLNLDRQNILTNLNYSFDFRTIGLFKSDDHINDFIYVFELFFLKLLLKFLGQRNGMILLDRYLFCIFFIMFCRGYLIQIFFETIGIQFKEKLTILSILELFDKANLF